MSKFFFIGVILLMVTACSLKSAVISPQVKDFFGEKALAIIGNSDRVESFRVNSTQDESSPKAIAGFPIIRQGTDLSGEQLTQIQSLIFDEKSYRFGVEKMCKFRPEMALRFVKNGESVDVLFSFVCDLWLFAYKGQEKIEDSDPIRKELVGFAHALFPSDKK